MTEPTRQERLDAQYGPVQRLTTPLLPEKVAFIAIHCSATPKTQDIGFAEIYRWHKLRGFYTIGYHYVIRRDGTVEKGRPDNVIGAHVEGFNSQSIGVCMVGGVDESKLMKPECNFTPAQFASLTTLVTTLTQTFPKAVVQGHRDFPNVAKACPSFDAKLWWSKASPK